MRIAIVAGELSGDQLGEGVVRLLKRRYPHAVIEGIAGSKMQAAGCRSLYPLEALSVMGVFEVLKHLPEILRIRRGLIRHFRQHKPDIYLGIDAPDFNLPVEKILKKQGVKTAHYVSPSVWAWRENRMVKIKAATDVVFALLPFEARFYQKHNHKAVFVGHPLANSIAMEPDTKAARSALSLDTNGCLIALLPGSRAQEVSRLLPIFLEALEKIRQHHPQVFAVLPLAKPSLMPIVEKYQNRLDALGVIIKHGQAHKVIEASDFVLVASGTATLETMLYKKPMVVCYKVSALTAFFVKRMIKTPYFSLPNILAGEEIVTELIQANFTVESCYRAMLTLIEDQKRADKMISHFKRLHQQLTQNADEHVVAVMAQMLGTTSE